MVVVLNVARLQLVPKLLLAPKIGLPDSCFLEEEGVGSRDETS